VEHVIGKVGAVRVKKWRWSFVQERLAHSVMADTLGIYSQTTQTLHDEAAGTVAAQLYGRPVAMR
jgi:hypothetical protein